MIETERLALRPFTGQDAAVIREKQITEASMEEVEGMIKAWESKTFQGKYFEMLALVANVSVVGSISLYEKTKKAASIGVEVFSDERGKGYAAEGMKLMIELARKRGYRIILDQVRADNAASIALHEKLGFETDGYLYENAKGHKVLIYLLCL
ncbi:MAG: GNAT family N-acetyltransferase [Clostridia bacterium]|nr:GNAT family N-acetyltransferase [Clostridia bacterium]MBR6186087.1 GNAT family N-acetyltransferase [Clostridia bacterium]